MGVNFQCHEVSFISKFNSAYCELCLSEVQVTDLVVDVEVTPCVFIVTYNESQVIESVREFT